MKTFLWPLIVLVIGYAGLLLWFRSNEARLLYFPDDPGRRLAAPPPSLGLRERRVEIPTIDGITLVGWIVPAPASDSSGRWLLLFHGNAGNISSEGRPDHDRQLRDLGLNLLAIDYRGYGESDGTPSEAGLYTDALAAYQYLRDDLGIPADQVIIYGHSLGSAVAIELATRVEAAGLIVEGGFTSVPARGQELYPFLPVRALARSRFESLDKIDRVAIPKLFIHGTGDQTIPIAHGRRLYEKARPPKTFLAVPGGHGDAYLVDVAAYSSGIAQFIEQVCPVSGDR